MSKKFWKYGHGVTKIDFEKKNLKNIVIISYSTIVKMPKNTLIFFEFFFENHLQRVMATLKQFFSIFIQQSPKINIFVFNLQWSALLI